MLNVSEEVRSRESGLFKVLYICFTDFLWITVCVMYSVKRKIKIKLYQPLSNGLFDMFREQKCPLHALFLLQKVTNWKHHTRLFSVVQ